jgi:hypothetical protein
MKVWIAMVDNIVFGVYAGRDLLEAKAKLIRGIRRDFTSQSRAIAWAHSKVMWSHWRVV